MRLTKGRKYGYGLLAAGRSLAQVKRLELFAALDQIGDLAHHLWILSDGLVDDLELREICFQSLTE